MARYSAGFLIALAFLIRRPSCHECVFGEIHQRQNRSIVPTANLIFFIGATGRFNHFTGYPWLSSGTGVGKVEDCYAVAVSRPIEHFRVAQCTDRIVVAGLPVIAHTELREFVVR